MRIDLDGSALGAVLLASTVTAQNVRLNAPFPPDSLGQVDTYALGPLGRVVYSANQDQFGSLELYNAPSDGSAPPIHLAAPGMSRTAGITLKVTADGEWLAYSTDAFGGLPERFFHLYSVPMDGSGSFAELSGTLVAGGSVRAYALGATRVVYQCDALVDETLEIFSAPFDGSSAPVRLSGTLVAGGDADVFAVSPDGTRVVYQADASIDATYELFTVPADGSAAPQRLHAPLSTGKDAFVLGELFSPDSSRVVFASNMLVAGAGELYSVPSDGSAAPVRLNPAFPSGRTVTAYAISPLSDTVVYRADQDADEVFELYTVPIDGGASVKLNAALAVGGDVISFRIGPDGQSVVYTADELVDGRGELFGVPIDAATPRVHLNGPLQPGGSVGEFRFSTDGTRVVYHANQEPGSGVELHGAPIHAAGASVRLSAPEVVNESLLDFVIAPAGRVLYRLHTLSGGGFISTIELFGVLDDGTGSPVVMSTSAEGDDVTDVAIDPANDHATFLVHRTQVVSTLTSSVELYAVPTDASALPSKLHPAMALGPTARDVSGFAHSPDGQWVVYVADQDTEGKLELFRTRADGTGAPVKLNAPVGSGGVGSTFAISPDSAWVVYRPAAANQPLFSVPIDGSAAPVALGAAGAAPTPVLVSADSARVVYRESGGLVQFYSVPIDGSAARVTLVSSSAGFSLPVAGISPDSSRFVFVADLETNDTFELFSVPIDGSAVPLKLSGALVAGGDVQSGFHVSPDSTRVVYVADANVDGMDELFSVPLDGSAAPVRLNGTLVPAGDVVSSTLHGYGITPDSTRVVYRADQLLNERFELFSAPIDGSASAVRLNAPMLPAGDVVPGTLGPAFVISPNSTRVVYRADQSADERFQLFSVPSDASAAPVVISGPSIPTGDVDEEFSITSDGARVVYQADAEVEGRPGLFVAPVDGSVAPVKLSRDRRVGSFELSPDGSGVVYLHFAGPFTNPTVALAYSDLDGGTKLDVTRLEHDEGVTAYSVRPDSLGVVFIADRGGNQVNQLWLGSLARSKRAVAAPPTQSRDR